MLPQAPPKKIREREKEKKMMKFINPPPEQNSRPSPKLPKIQ